ncbi:MAG TPA: alpha/beta hydrolase [Candidatus Dormibacteraeota bacterium]|nr:alpha/beta hydrolase [Candidatus Dormibacteraeota bacterium]
MEPTGRVQANGIDFAYLDAGPKDGPLALCLHGFPDHAPTYRHMLPALAAAGWHAVAPWSRGYHPTGLAPDEQYQSATLSLDALALLDALGGDERSVIIGHDWGSVASCGAGILGPERMAKVVCMAVPQNALAFTKLLSDWEQMKRSWYMWYLQLPGIYEMAFSGDDCAAVENIWRDWSPGLEIDAGNMAEIRGMLSRPEVFDAAVAYYRCTVDGTRQSDDLIEAQMSTTGDNLGVPALFICGADDGLFIPEQFHEGADYCTAECRVEVVEGAGHFMHLEKPDVVNRLVLDFIGAAVPAHAG